MNIKIPYKFCLTYHKNCKYARKTGFCSNKQKEVCVYVQSMTKYMIGKY